MAVTNTVTGKMNYLTVGSNTYEIEDKNAAPLASPAFTGTPTAPTPTTGDDSTKIATTAFVQASMAGAGAGTVTSVGIQNATSGGLSVSGSPITSSGTITIGLDTAYGDTKNPYSAKSPHYVLAGPSSGTSSAVPGFRALVASDIPDLSSTYLTSYTETDPIFSASAASGITSSDISNWNGKTSTKQGVWYGTCSTTASTAQKSVTCSGFELTTGNIIGVLFSTANTAATPTLSVNSTTAKSIYVGASTPNSTDNVLKWSANTMVYFQYDGTYYRYITSVSAGTVIPSRGANTWYGTSSTGATTQAKTSTIDNFVLTKGAVVYITFSTANTYTSAKITLNINSTGAKDVYYNNAVTSSTNTLPWNAGETLIFIYSGSYYYYAGKSITKVSQLVNDSGYITGISSSDVTTALGYTPYDSSNPSGYTSNAGTVTGMTTTAGTHTAGSQTVSNGIITTNIPTKTSHLTNDSGYITSYTDEKLAIAEVSSATQYYPIVGSGTTASTRQYDTTGFIYIGTNGTANTVGTANLTLGNATASGTVNNKRGQIYLYGTGTGRTGINTNVTSGTSIVSFPDKGGTVALTDDIIDENVKSTAVTAATTNYIVGSTTSTTTTGSLSKHASAVLYTTADSGTSGYTQLRLGNTTATSSAGGKEGQIRLYGTNATYYLDLKPGAIASSNKTITFPNATGTVALTSDIPTVPSITLNGASTASPSFYAPTSAGTNGYYLKSNGSGAPTWAEVESGGLATSYTNGTFNGTIDWSSDNNGCLTISNSYSTTSEMTGATFGTAEVNLYAGKINDDYSLIWINSANGVLFENGDSNNSYTVSVPKGVNGTLALTSDIPTITLNGSSTTSPSFYAPTSVGTSGYYLKSNGSGAPSWTAFPTIPTITLNGTATTSPSFYAPTSAGTSGYVLKSNGSGAPSWTSATLTDEKVKLTSQSTSGNYPITFGPTSITSNSTYQEYYDSDFYFNPSTNNLYVSSGTTNGNIYIGLATSDALYTAINSLGWVSSVIE